MKPPQLVQQFKSPLLLLSSSENTGIAGNSMSSFWTALIILNAPIRNPPSILFEQLWSIAQYRVCADGGANRLFQATSAEESIAQSSSFERTTENGRTTNTYVPDLITGDLDSLWDHVKEYYHTKDVPIIRDPDQDTNDLDKAIQAVMKRYNALYVSADESSVIDQSTLTTEQSTSLQRTPQQSSSSSSTTTTTTGSPLLPILRIIVYGAFGGRLDQEMASLQALYKWGGEVATNNESRIPPKQVVLYNDHTMAFLIQGGMNLIHYLYLALPDEIVNNPAAEQVPLKIQPPPPGRVYEGPTCGIIPLGQPVESITTTGLQWNLVDHPTSFGALLSTSNRIIGPVVTVTTSHPIIFTTEILPGTF